MNTHLLTEGLPCHKFILKSLATMNEAKVFTKNYINTMKKAGYDDDTIETSLHFFSAIAPQLHGRHDFTQWDKHVEGFTLIEDILFDNDVAIYKTCLQYYKTFDNKGSACALCPMSKRYKNARIESEKNVVLYALSSPANYEYVVSKGVKSEHFISVTDVTAQKTIVSKPYLYAFYKKTFEALLDDGVRADVFAYENDYEPILESYHTKKLTNIPAIENDCVLTVNTFCAVMIADMLSGDVCTKAEVDKHIANLIPEMRSSLSSFMKMTTSNTPDAIVLENSSNLGIKDINRFYDIDTKKQKDKNKKRQKKPVANATALNHSDSSVAADPEHGAEFETISIDSLFSDIPEVIFPTESVLTPLDTEDQQSEDTNLDDKALPALDMNNANIVNEIPAQKDIVLTPVEDICNSVVIEGVSAAASIEEPAEKSDKGNNKVSVSNNISSLPVIYAECDGEMMRFSSTQRCDYDAGDIPAITITELHSETCELYKEDENDFLGVPIVDEGELHRFAINLDKGNSHLLSLLESHTLKSKQLSLEVICTKSDGYYLLLYSPRLHAYLYTKLCNRNITEVLIPILSHQSIMKVCYYPYSLLGVMKKMGIHIKGLYSLFSASSVLYKYHHMQMDVMMECLGGHKAIGGVTVLPEGEILSPVLQYMHCYHNVFFRTRRKLLKKNKFRDYELANKLDTVLGMSYYQDAYSKESKLLFTLKNAGGYLFNDKVPDDFKLSGKCICFSFMYAPEDISDLIIYLLCTMYDTGMFHKTDTMILSMGNWFFSLFVKSEHVDYVETRINRMLLKRLTDLGLRGIDYQMTELPKGSAYCDLNE